MMCTLNIQIPGKTLISYVVDRNWILRNLDRKFAREVKWDTLKNLKNVQCPDYLIQELTDQTDVVPIEQILPNNIDRVIWGVICTYLTLSERFVREYEDRVEWNLVSSCQDISEDFLVEFVSRIVWNNIPNKPQICIPANSVTASSEVCWLSDVKRIYDQLNPRNLQFEETSRKPLRQVKELSNLKLFKGSLGYGVYTTSPIMKGCTIGEYCGELMAYEGISNSDDFAEIKQNSGYTMLLRKKSTCGKYVYIESSKAGSIA